MSDVDDAANILITQEKVFALPADLVQLVNYVNTIGRIKDAESD